MSKMTILLNFVTLVLAFIQFVSGQNFHSLMSEVNYTEYKAAPGSWIKALNKSSIAMPAGTTVHMQFAEIHAEPGHIREIHWHINSGEWVYIKTGKCEFTLMDNEGRYNIMNATVGDVWYFPKGWQHSFQAVDPVEGCDLLLWFDTNDINIDLTHTIAELPFDIVKRNLGNMPDQLLNSLMFPLYNDMAPGGEGIVAGQLPIPAQERCKGGEKQNPCAGSLKNWPVFPMKGGKRVEVPGAGVEYTVKNDMFPAALTMSGGLLEMPAGAIREVHWHPDAEEQHYVLKGKVQVTVYGVEEGTKAIMKETYTLDEGDLGVVPINYIHYVAALEDTTLLITFNTPRWQTQTLSETFVTTPTHIIAGVFGTTEEIVDTFFPQKSVKFIPPP